MQVFTVNGPKIIYQAFQDEVILINLELGSYFSLEGTGAEVWALLEAGADRASIIEQLAGAYQGAPDEVSAGVDRFLDNLLEEGLIAAADGQPAAAGQHRPSAEGEKPRFEPPSIAKYTDMEDLLMLDPIHDVDETGWPAKNRP